MFTALNFLKLSIPQALHALKVQGDVVITMDADLQIFQKKIQIIQQNCSRKIRFGFWLEEKTF